MGSLHQPVLVDEVLAWLMPREELNSIIVDGTVGGGGHAVALARRLGAGGRVIGLDRDSAMLDLAEAAVAAAGSPLPVTLIHAAYRDMRRVLDSSQEQTRTLRMQAAVLISPDMARVDLAGLVARLKTVAPDSQVDDHGHWIARLKDLADTIVWSAYGILILIAIATASIVAFATRAGLEAQHVAAGRGLLIVREKVGEACKESCCDAVARSLIFQLFNDLRQASPPYPCVRLSGL